MKTKIKKEKRKPEPQVVYQLPQPSQELVIVSDSKSGLQTQMQSSLIRADDLLTMALNSIGLLKQSQQNKNPLGI